MFTQQTVEIIYSCRTAVSVGPTMTSIVPIERLIVRSARKS